VELYGKRTSVALPMTSSEENLISKGNAPSLKY